MGDRFLARDVQLLGCRLRDQHVCGAAPRRLGHRPGRAHQVRGFKLADGSTVKTKPTNIDTDNDKRTDGAEAGLAGGELIVRLPAGEVYPASSNPTRADTDFDLLVDGDEQVYGIDPTLANTDKDNRTDYSEVLAGRRPEVPDMLVKMEFVRLFVEQDAEGAGDSGDFRFEFSVVKPDTTTTPVVDSVLPLRVRPGHRQGLEPLPRAWCRHRLSRRRTRLPLESGRPAPGGGVPHRRRFAPARRARIPMARAGPVRGSLLRRRPRRASASRVAIGEPDASGS